MISCRLCQHKLAKPFLSLGKTPLANSFLSDNDLLNEEATYPLELFLCPSCYLVQIDEMEQAESIFGNNYAYFSSFSDTWLKHSENYAKAMINRFNLNKNSLVLEIASNDGYLLKYFIKKDIPVLGIEPAKNVAQKAIQNGVETEIVFFGTKTAQQLSSQNKTADLIVANNVLAHVPDLNDFVQGFKLLLKEDGIITIEVPHLLNLLNKTQFDTIYHEHFSYFLLFTAKKLFESHDLKIFDVEELPTHGGSLRIYITHTSNNAQEISPTVNSIVSLETKAGLTDEAVYAKFQERVKSVKEKLVRTLDELKSNGKIIIGYGAPAKGNTLLNYCGISSDQIDYTVDLNPFKQDKYLPGSRIAVRHPDQIKSDKPDYVLILPWNIKDEIIEQLSYIKDWGGKFIIPIPEPKIIS